MANFLADNPFMPTTLWHDDQKVVNALTDIKTALGNPLYRPIIDGTGILKAAGLDQGAAGALAIGATNATSLTLGKAGVPAQAAGGLLAPSLDVASAGALSIGGSTATSLTLGKAGVPAQAAGGFKGPSLDVISAAALTLGPTTATSVDLGASTIPARVYGIASAGMSSLSSCAALYYVNTTAAYTNSPSPPQVVNFDIKLVDTDNAVTTGAGWKFTCPAGKGGLYFVSVTVGWNSATANTSFYGCEAFKNGAAIGTLGAAAPVPASNPNWFTTTATAVVALAPGDTVDGRQINNQTVGGPIQIAGGGWSSITIYRIPGS